jgi:conjugal transfer/entry exclusion protein
MCGRGDGRPQFLMLAEWNVVSLDFASWNQITEWMSHLQVLRQVES